MTGKVCLEDSDDAAKIIDILNQRKVFTPDFTKLKKYSNIVLFVYDDMKRFGRESGLLKDAKFLGEAKTHSNNYMMNICCGDRIVFFENKTVDKSIRGYIKGEAYVVPPEKFFELDRKKLNGHKFSRHVRSIILNDQTVKMKHDKIGRPSVMAQMYIAETQYWDDRKVYPAASMIPEGNKNKRYYDYPINQSVLNNNIWGRNPENDLSYIMH